MYKRQVLAYDQKEIDRIDPENMFESMGEKSNGFELPGWEPERMARIKELFEMYRDVDADRLFDNLVYFLKAIQPVCEKYDIRMAIHPDDPAWPVFGLARIMTGKEQLLKLMKAVDAPFNGVTQMCIRDRNKDAGLSILLFNGLPEPVQVTCPKGPVIKTVSRHGYLAPDSPAVVRTHDSVKSDIVERFHDFIHVHAAVR